MHTGAHRHTAGPLCRALTREPWRVLLALAWAALAPRPARADPLDGIVVGWTGPDSCPDHGDVAAEARRLLPAEGAYEPTQIAIVVHELAAPRAGYRMSFTASSESRTAERTLQLATCAQLREAASLLIALTLDPQAVAAAEAVALPAAPQAQPAPEPQAPSVRPAPIEAPPQAPPAPAESLRPSPPAARARAANAKLALGPELAAGAALDSHVMPQLALGPFVAAGIRASALRLSLGALYLPGAERAVSDGGSIRATLIAGQLGACAMWRIASALEAGPCAGAELGRYGARARGVTHGESDATLWAAASAGACAALSLGSRLALAGSISVLAPLRRPVLGLEGMASSYVVPPLSLRAALGVRWF